MAIQTAGQKTAKATKLRIENQSTIDLPKGTEEHLKKVLDYLPIEHMRGLEKIRLVDFINDPRLKNMDVPVKGDLPGLYHPRVQNQNGWLEVSVGALLQPTEAFAKRWMAKSSFKANVAGLVFSLVGQHYFLTLKHSVKKQNLEPQIAVRGKELRAWRKNKTGQFRQSGQTDPPARRTLGEMVNKSGASSEESIELWLFLGKQEPNLILSMNSKRIKDELDRRRNYQARNFLREMRRR